MQSAELYELENWLRILKESKVLALDLKHISEVEKENIAVIKILSKIIQSIDN